MHPHLDLADQLIRMFGWPALLGALVWTVRKWDKQQREWKDISENARTAAQGIAEVKGNHLVHLQDGITRLAGSNDQAVTILQDISKGIGILIDRTPRA